MALLSEEQSLIKDQARSWTNSKAPVRAFRRMRDSGVPEAYLPEVWQGMAELGWPGILVPEAFGGADLGYLTMGVVLEETGRQLTASPLFASALVGTTALRLGGSEAQQQALFPKLLDGSEVLTLAVDEGSRHEPAGIALQAKPASGGFTLSGQKSFVLEAPGATRFVVAARTSGAPGSQAGISLFLVPRDAQGLTIEPLGTADSRGYGNVSFNNVQVAADDLLGAQDQGWPLLEAILDRARAGIAAEMLGTGAQAFDMTLEYLKTREQFGQVIGGFQALGHRAAELYTKLELARSCVEAALQAIDNDTDNIPARCSLAKFKAGEFLYKVSNELIQIHGGIGMTDDFDAGFYLKRARSVEALFGNQAFHRDRFASLQGF